MIIRNETPEDYTSISNVTLAAFSDHPISNHTEQFIINALRLAGALTISLVCEIEGEIVGHIAFSPVKITDGSTGWYGLGPVSVLPALQRQGIGTALILKGISMLNEIGGQGCALVGDPNYYKRFGYINNPDLIYEGIPQEYFLVLPFYDNTAKGVVEFHQGFMATE
jgi:putative acetyltransferase